MDRNKNESVHENKDENRKLVKGLCSVYECFSHWCIFCILIALMIITMVADYVHCPYWTPQLEQMFSYDAGNLIAIIVIMWTGMVTITMYYLGRLDECHYGIRLVDMLRAKWTAWHLVRLSVLVLSELLVLIMAAIGEWPVTIATVAVLQFFTMIYLFLMICMEMSNYVFLKRAKEELSIYFEKINRYPEEGVYNQETLLLFQMIQNMSFKNRRERQDLLGIIKETSWDSIYGNSQRKISRKLVSGLWERKKSGDVISDMLIKWFMCKKSTQDIKKGILSVLLEELEPESFRICCQMLTIEPEYKRELYIYCIVYTVFLAQYESEDWRMNFACRLYASIDLKWYDKDVDCALKYWQEICSDRNEPIRDNFYDVCRYIFGEVQENEGYSAIDIV